MDEDCGHSKFCFNNDPYNKAKGICVKWFEHVSIGWPVRGVNNFYDHGMTAMHDCVHSSCDLNCALL